MPTSKVPHSVAGAARVTEGPSVTQPYLEAMLGAVPATERVTPGNSLTPIDLCALLADAIDATGTRKVAAIDMDVKPPVLSRQLQQTDGKSPSLARVSRLRRETLAEFGRRILGACGVGDPHVERQQAAEEAMRAITRLVVLSMAGRTA